MDEFEAIIENRTLKFKGVFFSLRNIGFQSSKRVFDPNWPFPRSS